MKLGYFVALALFALCAKEEAQSYPTVTAVPCIHGCTNSLDTTDYHLTPYIYVAGYYANADGGQGEFQLASCTPDAGSCVSGGGTTTWQRLNLDGSVEQFGAVPALSGDNLTNNSYSAFKAAFSAAQHAGLGTVYVKGNQNGSRYYLNNTGGSAALAILQGMKLQCLTAPAGQSETSAGQSTGNYGAVPFTLVVPYTQTIQVGQASQLQGCEVQQAGLNTQPTATYRSLASTVAAMAGTAITFGGGSPPTGTGDNAEIRDVTIIGFNTGIYSNKNNDIKITNVMDDSTRCADIQSIGVGIATIKDFYCYPLLTRLLKSTTNQPSFFLTNIADNGSGEYRATLCPATYSYCYIVGGGSPPCTTGVDCPTNGDTIWISNPQGAESSGGRWTLENCNAGPPYTCDLKGSMTSATYYTATGTFAAGATEISSVPPYNFTVLQTTNSTTLYGPGDTPIRLLTASPTLPKVGQIVSVTGFTQGDTPEANGVWLVDAVGTSGSLQYYIDLHNSVMINACGGAGHPSCPSGSRPAKVEWGYPSVGQNVSGGSAIDTGTTVTRVWPAQDVVFLSKPTLLSETGGIGLSYTDNPFGFGSSVLGIAQCSSPRASDICITVTSTRDLISGISDVIVVNTTTSADNVWHGVILGNAGVNPGTVIDLPCPSGSTCTAGTFANSGAFYTGYMRLDAGQRAGDSLYLANANDVDIVNFQTYQHECGLHLGTGTVRVRAVNVKSDQYDAIDDLLFCGIKFDGTAEGNVVVNGELNAAGIDVINDATETQTADATNTVENFKLGNTAQSVAYTAMFEDDGKDDSLALAHNTSDAVGYALVSDTVPGVTLTGNFMPQVSLYFDLSGTAQTATAGMLNQFALNTPNKATMGSCSSTTSLTTPIASCGFIGVPTGTYTGGTLGFPTTLNTMFANVAVTAADSNVIFGDPADGSGKCHWVIDNNSVGVALNVLPAGSDKINGASSFSIPGGKMGIFCTYTGTQWWGGTLN